MYNAGMDGPLSLLLAAPFVVGVLKAPEVPAAKGSARAAPQAVVVEGPSGGVLGQDALFARLAAARVVYVGEKHDEALHHQVQLEVLKELHARKPGLVVGLEMIDRSKQSTLDDWQAGHIDDDAFKTFWRKAWGFDYALYEPILAYAKANAIPLKALNAPISVISKVYRSGLGALIPAERAQLAARVEQTSDPDYLAYIRTAIEESHGHPTPERMANMLEAQAAWNETMGESAAQALADGAETVLVLAGHGHMAFRAGIAESVARRRAAAQAVVIPWPEDGGRAPLADMLRDLRDPAQGRLRLADYFWLLPD